MRQKHGRLKAEAKARKDDAAFRAAEEIVNAARTKTTDIEVLTGALRARGGAFEALHAVWGSEAVVRGRFHVYMATQKTLLAMVRLVAPDESHVVVLGDADFCCTMKGQPAGVAGRFARALVRQLGKRRVVEQDEFRTSKLDSRPGHVPLVGLPKQGEFVNKMGRAYVPRVHGILQAPVPGNSVTWNRDVNAAINIVNLFKYRYDTGDVPVPFRRSTPKPVGYKWQRYVYARVEGSKRFKRTLADVKPHIPSDASGSGTGVQLAT